MEPFFPWLMRLMFGTKPTGHSGSCMTIIILLMTQTGQIGQLSFVYITVLMI